MAHVAKFNRSSSGHMLKHYERAKDEKGNYINFGNENIDIQKSHMNYNLAPNKNQMEFLQKRCGEVSCLNRKDVNVMCSWVITLPKDLPKEQEREFFEQSYEFLENRYKKENVISAHVHMDEVTPHIHFCFVPVIHDKKKNKDKVSAKEVVNKRDLQTFHKDLSNRMECHFGRDIGILNEVTKDGNKSVLELKKQTVAEETQKVNETFKSVKNLSDTLSKNEEHIKGVIGKLDNIEVKKGFLSDKLTISEYDYSILVNLAKSGESKIVENLQLKGKISKLEKNIGSLQQKLNSKSLDEELNAVKLRKYSKIAKEHHALEQSFKRVEKAIQNLDLVDDVNREIGKIRIKEKSYDMER